MERNPAVGIRINLYRAPWTQPTVREARFDPLEESCSVASRQTLEMKTAGFRSIPRSDP